MAEALYDEIGHGYATRRRPDPSIAAAIDAALGDARAVVNVGAGSGSYEPADVAVTAVEPSAVMLAQRPAGAAPAVQASAAELPIPHDCSDGFYGAHWRRPEASLDPAVRASISVFGRLPHGEVTTATARLRDDRASGRWHECHADLLDRAELDLGYVILVAELDRAQG